MEDEKEIIKMTTITIYSHAFVWEYAQYCKTIYYQTFY